MTLLAISCTHSIWSVGARKEYKKFLAANWIDGRNGVYHFKGDPMYWRKDIYPTFMKEEFLIGIGKQAVVEAFGNPTKTYSNPALDLYIYCMDSLCLKTPVYGPHALYFEFQHGKVSGVFTNPSVTGLPDFPTEFGQ